MLVDLILISELLKSFRFFFFFFLIITVSYTSFKDFNIFNSTTIFKTPKTEIGLCTIQLRANPASASKAHDAFSQVLYHNPSLRCKKDDRKMSLWKAYSFFYFFIFISFFVFLFLVLSKCLEQRSSCITVKTSYSNYLILKNKF